MIEPSHTIAQHLGADINAIEKDPGLKIAIREMGVINCHRLVQNERIEVIPGHFCESLAGVRWSDRFQPHLKRSIGIAYDKSIAGFYRNHFGLQYCGIGCDREAKHKGKSRDNSEDRIQNVPAFYV